ncbi:hypothetical protein [Spirosoma areae]
MKNTLPFPSPVALLLATDTLVSVFMGCDGADYLREQVERDITAKGLGWRPLPFTLFELLEIERLLPDETCNRVMFRNQSRLLAQYCNNYYNLACEVENSKLMWVYGQFLDHLLDLTEITFLL